MVLMFHIHNYNALKIIDILLYKQQARIYFIRLKTLHVRTWIFCIRRYRRIAGDECVAKNNNYYFNKLDLCSNGSK